MTIEPNPFKRAIGTGRRQIGVWSNLSSTLSAEIVAGASFDWVVLDAEHSPSELPDILAQLQAVSAYAVEPVVRIPENDRTLIKKYLDVGVRSLLLPFVETVDDARNAVAYTRYPPMGVRGVSVGHRADRFGRVKDYLATAHEQICILVQIETEQALDALPEIVEVEGVDAAVIGPSDLAASLGHLGDAGHPDVRAAIEGASQVCREHGKPIGILAPVEDDARRYFESGFTFVAVGSDLGLLARGSEALRAKFRDIVP